MAKVIIPVCRVGRDPERKTENLVTFSVAESRRVKDQEHTDWHDIACFGKTGELAERYLSKGSRVFIEGRLSYNESEKDGVKRKFTSVIADNLVFLDPKRKTGEQQSFNDLPSAEQLEEVASSTPVFDDDDDIPFSI